MKIYYSDHHTYPLPPGHTFPAEKYPRLRFSLLDQGVLQESELVQSSPASMQQILLAHSNEYYTAVCDGSIDKRILRQLGLPWSEKLVIRSHTGIGGVIAAAREAMQSGFSGALSGGTHHAFRDEGRGFCVFNDTAVAVLTLLENQEITRCAVVDLDAHQGNGTASILNGLPQVFILDIHGEKNYPVRKVATSFDIALPDQVEDEAYLDCLSSALASVAHYKPDLIFYIAGVDPLQGDRFGRMALTMQGLMERDRMVFQIGKENHIPIVISMGGGYADPIDMTVEAHVNTYRAAKKIYGA